MLALARGLVGNGLGRQVDFDFRFRIGKNRVEKLGQKRFTNHHRKNKVIQFIVFVDIRKETGYDYAKPVICNRPSSVLATGTRTEVLPCHQYLSTISRIVQNKRFYFVALLIVPPIAEEVFTEPLFVGCFQEAGRNDLVRIHILKRKGDASRCYDVEFLFHYSFLLDLYSL